jgi:rubrerythrin
MGTYFRVPRVRFRRAVVVPRGTARFSRLSPYHPIPGLAFKVADWLCGACGFSFAAPMTPIGCPKCSPPAERFDEGVAEVLAATAQVSA